MNGGENKLIRRRLANAYLSAVISISLVLLLVGVASLLLVNARSVSDYFKENMQISVLLKPEIEDAEATAFQSELDSLPYIHSTRFISREEGTEEMKAMLREELAMAKDASATGADDISIRAISGTPVYPSSTAPDMPNSGKKWTGPSGLGSSKAIPRRTG